MREKPAIVILTVDAGGTNFVFSIVRNGIIWSDSVSLSAEVNSEAACTKCLIKGFEKMQAQTKEPVSAISFAFPGPADYRNGIIRNPPNFPGISSDYPLKTILESHFGLPVFINNDGNLFAYGEALAGMLPSINKQLKQRGSTKQFHNLIGLTLGTGIGAGLVFNDILLIGDNSAAAEIHNLMDPNHEDWNIEESISIRAIQRIYENQHKHIAGTKLSPREIYEIAKGLRHGEKEAALIAFQIYGQALGLAITSLITLFDGLVVIGGGITAAWDLFAPSMFSAINGPYENPEKGKAPKTTVKVFDYQNKEEAERFLNGDLIQKKEASSKQDSMPRTAVILSENKASHSISLGAYYFALDQLGINK